MRTKISILLILISLLGYSQQQPTWFGGGVRLYNATEQTSFSLGHERIPLMQTNGIINSFIHSDSLVVQSQIKGFALLNAENTFKERNIFEKEIIVLTNGNDNLFNNNTIHNGLFTANGGLNSNGTTTLAGTQNFSGTLTMSGVMNYDPVITNTIIDSESDNIIINKRWFNANTKTYQAGTNITIDNTDPLNPVINATSGGGGGSATNLSYTASATNGVVSSSTGTNATIPTVTTTNAGLQKPDFYEEGLWTPVLYDPTNNPISGSIRTPACQFVRVGNIVHFSLRVTEITGTLSSISLPFSSFSVNEMVSVKVRRSINATNFDIQQEYSLMAVGITDKFFLTGVENNNLTLTYSAPGNDLVISGTYKTNVYTP